MNRKDIKVICDKLSVICKLLANDEDNSKVQKKKLLKFSEEFKGLGEIKSKKEEKQ